MSIKETLLRILLKIYYRIKFNIIVDFNDFNPKRTDPYFLIGNHACLQDGLFTSIFLKRYPYPIINSFAFTNRMMKFLLTKMIYAIPKRKGQNDISTIREMMRVVKNGRGIMLFPEGNASLFGEQSVIPFSTVKLLKKFKLDIVICLTNGAYLTMPRWGDVSTKRGLIKLNYYRLFKGDELDNYSLDEIFEKLVAALKFNDFDWNREFRYSYKAKKRALGLEKYIYYCPKCKKHQTIKTKNNDIFCDNCGLIASFNHYSLLTGLEFDNLVAWDKLQKSQLPLILKEVIYTFGSMFKVDMTELESQEMGYADIELVNKQLFVQNRMKEFLFELDKIIGLTLTRKNEVSFDYGKDTYLFKLNDPLLIYDAIKYLKGEK